MHAVVFDTLKLARKLERAGFSSKPAQDAAAALAESLGEWHGASQIATMDNIHGLETKIDTSNLELNAKIDSSVAQLRTEIATTKTDVIKWVVGMGFAQMLAILGLLKL